MQSTHEHQRTPVDIMYKKKTTKNSKPNIMINAIRTTWTRRVFSDGLKTEKKWILAVRHTTESADKDSRTNTDVRADDGGGSGRVCRFSPRARCRQRWWVGGWAARQIRMRTPVLAGGRVYVQSWSVIRFFSQLSDSGRPYHKILSLSRNNKTKIRERVRRYLSYGFPEFWYVDDIFTGWLLLTDTKWFHS